MAVDKVIIEYQLKTDQLRKELDEVKAQMGMVEKEGVKTTNNLSNNFQELGRNIANAFAIREIILFSKEATKLASTVESLNVQLKFVLGSQEAANDAMKFARNIATTLALDIQATTSSYTKFISATKVSGMALNESNKIFKAVATASRAMNLSVEQTEGSFYALQQMVSKGVVSSEELNQQLGERLPGAFGIAARSIGVTEIQLRKMMDTGQVLAKDFLPAFAEELQRTFEPAIADSLETYNAKLTEFNNKLYDVKVSLGTDLMPVLTEFFDILMKGWDGASDAINRYFAFFGNKVALDNIQNEKLRENTAAILEQGLSYEELGKQIAATDAALLEHAKNNTVYNYKTNIFGKKVTDGLNESYAELQDNYYALVEAQKITGATMTETTGETIKYTRALTDEEKAVQKAAKALKKAEQDRVAKMFADALKRIPEALDELPAAIKEWEKFIDAVTADTPKATAEFEKMTDALEKQEDIFNEIGFSGLALNPVVQNLTQAYKDGLLTLDQYSDAIQEIITAQNEAADSALTLAEKQEQGQEAALQIAQAVGEFKGALWQKETDDYIAQLDAQLAAGKISQETFDRLSSEALAENAKKQKEAAMFDIIIKTAQAVIALLAQGNVAGSLAAGITGALQLAVVSGAPIPAFAEGVVDLKGKGTETSDEILARLSRGESVITARGTRQDKGLFEAANKMQLDEYINKNYVLPVLLKKQSEQQSAFDDYRLWLATMSNGKKMEKGNKEIVKAIKQTGFNQRRYWA